MEHIRRDWYAHLRRSTITGSQRVNHLLIKYLHKLDVKGVQLFVSADCDCQISADKEICD